MNQTRRRPQLFAPTALALATVVLWLIHASAARHPLLGHDPLKGWIEVAAVISTGLLFVAGAGWLIHGFAHPGGPATRLTGLESALVNAVLSLAALAFALSYFGYDLRAVLATSAIVTAAVGFAMQPTLGSMISGIALDIDRTVRPGDGIRVSGECVRVESLNWRNVIARKADGRMLVIPNAKLADAELEVLPHDRPVRGEISFKMPAWLPPHRVSDLVTELISDFAHLDTIRPIVVLPGELEIGADAIHYSVRYWTRRYEDAGDLEGELLRRLWYGFQRHGLHVPPANREALDWGGLGSSVAWRNTDSLAELVAAALPTIPAEAASALATDGQALMFAAGERIALPDRTDGWSFLLLRGEAEVAPEFATASPEQDELPRLPSHQLGRRGIVQQLTDKLADHIGPYAEYAVRRAARTARDIPDLRRKLALEIPDEAARARFLLGAEPNEAAILGPGIVFQAQRNAAGLLISDRRLRTCAEVMVLAVPPRLSDRLETSKTARASAKGA